MPFIVTVERLPHYVLLQVSGLASLQNYCDLVDETAQQTVAHGYTRALVDLRDVEGRLGFTDQFFIGDFVSQKLAHLAKLASVVPQDPKSYNSHRVANRKGMNMRMFGSEAQATAWLLDGAA
jgi:hypothetical protein